MASARVGRRKTEDGRRRMAGFRGERRLNSTRSAPDAVHEKRRVALSSVLAALVLTGLKLIVGLLTGSLGILSEALHSGLDLAAAAITLIAVRVADRPADTRHLYGHGKVENLSALAETLLLLATATWVIYEAIQRLFFKVVEVEASLWAFGVMALSIVVDVSRSRVLMRAARKHESQALEADALHFSTDVWSSAVVIAGLIGVRLAEMEPRLHFLVRADAVAAIGVSCIVILVGARVGQRAIAALMDTAPEGTVEKVKAAVRQVTGVVDCENVRVRGSGADIFVDVTVKVKGDQPLTAAHAIADQAEEAVRRVLPRADVVVHTEPYVKRKP
jgi:cation diffusion facilitator family transporter